jgi:hypothetical protein
MMDYGHRAAFLPAIEKRRLRAESISRSVQLLSEADIDTSPITESNAYFDQLGRFRCWGCGCFSGVCVCVCVCECTRSAHEVCCRATCVFPLVLCHRLDQHARIGVDFGRQHYWRGAALEGGTPLTNALLHQLPKADLHHHVAASLSKEFALAQFANSPAHRTIDAKAWDKLSTQNSGALHAATHDILQQADVLRLVSVSLCCVVCVFAFCFCVYFFFRHFMFVGRMLLLRFR